MSVFTCVRDMRKKRYFKFGELARETFLIDSRVA